MTAANPQSPGSFDVVIVGGGVNGCSTAYWLASSDDFVGSIAVIERDPSYQNAPSARATGGIRQQFSTPENIQIGLFGAHFVKNISEYLSIDGIAPELAFHEGGYLLLANSDQATIMRENNAVQRRHGAQVALHSPAELAARFPWLNTDGLSLGAFGVQDEGWLDPYLLLQAFRAKARALGVKFVHAEAVELKTRGRRVNEVRLADGTVLIAGQVVNAAGAAGAAALAESARVRLPIESRKRFTFVFTTRENLAPVPLTILPEGLAFRPEGSTYLANLAPSADADPECFDHEIDYPLFEETIWPILANRVPAFEAIKLSSAWCCHYDFNTFDENAIVGPAGDFENLYVLVGFSGHGLQQSPAMGRATAELITYGEFRTLDLSRMRYGRIERGERLLERNCY